MSAETMYLIRKHGLFYRPNSEGYTACVSDAGRYTLAEAEEITHPNGPNGSRDGMDFIEAPTTRLSEPVSAPAVGGDGVALVYRPNEFDDWGMIRTADGEPFATVTRPLSRDEANKHRAQGTDPFEPLARALMSVVPPTPTGGDREVEAVASAVRSFAEAVLHGDDEHRGWLIEAAECFVAGKSLPEARGKGASQTAVEAALADRDATIVKLEDALRVARENLAQMTNDAIGLADAALRSGQASTSGGEVGK